jgi:hypothetical protein
MGLPILQKSFCQLPAVLAQALPIIWHRAKIKGNTNKHGDDKEI